MGLDAVVFTNVRRLEEAYGRGLFDVDEGTGEAILKPNLETQIPRSAYFAAKQRLGNLAEVAELRSSLAAFLPARNSVLMDKALYAGSHSGDRITLDDFDRLRREMAIVKIEQPGAARHVVEALESLLHAAEVHQNPIVFV